MKAGYEPVEALAPPAANAQLRLLPAGSVPEGMVYVGRRPLAMALFGYGYTRFVPGTEYVIDR